ncbi:MAG: glycosyl-transferase for dystroglycan-domain-containing protein [Monoraphidium minutum]|nr:MAG: glycosyl-transferase for dystroglycan-domain-containing protein [Monoraphidium minutum]
MAAPPAPPDAAPPCTCRACLIAAAAARRRRQARTRLVAMIDVDLLVSATLATWMESKDNVDYIQRECAAKRVFVLPAFETPRSPDAAAAHAVAGQAVAADKRGLKEMVDKKLVHQFALYLFREGHNMTEYARWFATGKPYQVAWTQDYEPWFIVDRLYNPFYDSVFRGYGWNKVTHVNNVNGMGFTFMVHPNAWIVHRQHDRSAADKMYQSGKKEYEAAAKADPKKGEESTSLAGMTHRFRNRVLARLAAGAYAPAVDAGVGGCITELAWWRRDGRGGPAYDDDYD